MTRSFYPALRRVWFDRLESSDSWPSLREVARQRAGVCMGQGLSPGALFSSYWRHSFSEKLLSDWTAPMEKYSRMSFQPMIDPEMPACVPARLASGRSHVVTSTDSCRRFRRVWFGIDRLSSNMTWRYFLWHRGNLDRVLSMSLAAPGTIGIRCVYGY